MDWPRTVSTEHPDRGERPLHFVAQVSCAALPTDLWAGLGPRTGWLLLFVDPNQGCPDGPDAFRVIHTLELGRVRPPPTDLGPVHDGVYTGPQYDHYRTAKDVPSQWRRWPVDVVEVLNAARTLGQRTLAAPERFDEALYPGRPVADLPRDMTLAPFTWGGLVLVLDGVERALRNPLPPTRVPPKLAERLSQPGYIASIVQDLDGRDAAWLALNGAMLSGPEPEDPVERKRRASIREHRESRHRTRQALASFLSGRTGADLLAYLERADLARSAWRDKARVRVTALRAAASRRGADDPLSSSDWLALVNQLKTDAFAAWTNRWVDREGEALHVSFERRTFSLWDIAERLVRPVVLQTAADSYVDPARCGSIPADLLAPLEASWRRFYENRPHRMGGYHDGLQSDAQIGPQSELLLFQIATDDAMTWVWGDGGAHYVWITPDALETGDFSRARLVLECH